TNRREPADRLRRMVEPVEAAITSSDPEAFVRPVNASMRFRLSKENRPELRPMYNACSDTNGPSALYHMDEDGKLDERLPGDPLFWDNTDSRPWGTWLTESDKRNAQFKKK